MVPRLMVIPMPTMPVRMPISASKTVINELMAGAVTIAFGVVMVVIAMVVVSAAQGIGAYILTSLNSTGQISAPNYVNSLNIGTVVTIIGVSLIVIGAVFIISALIKLGRAAREEAPE